MDIAHIHTNISFQQQLVRSDEFILLPNPCNGQFTLLNSGRAEGLSVTIVGAHGIRYGGRKVSAAGNRTELEVSHFHRGACFILIRVPDGVLRKRLILQ
ncbi:MAG: T9SS type A sorting domain-containing protein [Lewinella sp.]